MKQKIIYIVILVLIILAILFGIKYCAKTEDTPPNKELVVAEALKKTDKALIEMTDNLSDAITLYNSQTQQISYNKLAEVGENNVKVLKKYFNSIEKEKVVYQFSYRYNKVENDSLKFVNKTYVEGDDYYSLNVVENFIVYEHTDENLNKIDKRVIEYDVDNNTPISYTFIQATICNDLINLDIYYKNFNLYSIKMLNLNLTKQDSEFTLTPEYLLTLKTQIEKGELTYQVIKSLENLNATCAYYEINGVNANKSLTDIELKSVEFNSNDNLSEDNVNLFDSYIGIYNSKLDLSVSRIDVENAFVYDDAFFESISQNDSLKLEICEIYSAEKIQYRYFVKATNSSINVVTVNHTLENDNKLFKDIIDELNTSTNQNVLNIKDDLNILIEGLKSLYEANEYKAVNYYIPLYQFIEETDWYGATYDFKFFPRNYFNTDGKLEFGFNVYKKVSDNAFNWLIDIFFNYENDSYVLKAISY